MKRIALATFVLGIVFVLAPAAQARVMSDDSGGGNAVTLMTDTLGGGGIASQSVAIRPDILGGDGGGSAPVPILTDTLAGNGGNSDVVLWLTNQLEQDRAAEQASIVSSNDDSFAWGETAGVTIIVGMLLVLTATAVTRRRHRLSF
jgi:hypothetical protein